MDIMQSVRTVLNNYANFDGRSGRAEFWWWMLAYFVGYLLLGFISGLLGLGGWLGTLYWLGLIVPTVAVSIRRFHDIGKPAIWAIALFIPLVNIVVALIFLTKPSDGPNTYGAAPQPAAAEPPAADNPTDL